MLTAQLKDYYFKEPTPRRDSTPGAGRDKKENFERCSV